MGFGGFAIDYVDGPAPVINMLCHDALIQDIPVSARPLDARQSKECENAGFRRWIGGKTIYSCNRRYGVTSTKVGNIPQARIFNTQQVDTSQKSALEDKIKELNYQLEEIRHDLETKKSAHSEVREEANRLIAEKRAIQTEKNEAQTALSKYNGQVAKLQTVEQKIKDSIKAGESFKERIKGLEALLEKLTTKRAKAAIEHIVGFLIHDMREALTAGLANRWKVCRYPQQMCADAPTLR